MSATIETGISSMSFLSEAIFTAVYIEDISKLFDRLNSSKLSPCGNRYKFCINDENSRHFGFRNKIFSTISSFELISKQIGKQKVESTLSFRNGEVRTISAIKNIWKLCKENGDIFLITNL